MNKASISSELSLQDFDVQRLHKSVSSRENTGEQTFFSPVALSKGDESYINDT